MGVIRTALLTVAFALVGLCWMAGCQAEHGPSANNLQAQITELRELYGGLVYQRAVDKGEVKPSPSLTPHELGMINSWYAEPTPSPSPTEFFGSDGAPNMICNDSNIGDLASVNSAIWRCNGFYWYAMEPTPSPSPTPEHMSYSANGKCYADDPSPDEAGVYSFPPTVHQIPCASATPAPEAISVNQCPAMLGHALTRFYHSNEGSSGDIWECDYSDQEEKK